MKAEEALEPELRICDPHVHIVDLPGFQYRCEEHQQDTGGGHRVVSSIYVEAGDHYRTSGPEHLRPVGEVEFARRLHVQTRRSHTWVAKGVVGFVDLTQGALTEEALEAQIHAGGGMLRGIRHSQAWDETGSAWNSGWGPGLFARPTFRAGVEALTLRGLSLDTWQYYYQLPSVVELARDFPYTPIMIDHVGGIVGVGAYAGRRDEIFGAWRAHIRELARLPNVWIKLGGLGMAISGFGFEGRDRPVPSETLAAAWKPYMDTCIEAFGPARCMFESNFPPDRDTCAYGVLWNAFKRIAEGATNTEKALLFHDSASHFYRLDEAPAQ